MIQCIVLLPAVGIGILKIAIHSMRLMLSLLFNGLYLPLVLDMSCILFIWRVSRDVRVRGVVKRVPHQRIKELFRMN